MSDEKVINLDKEAGAIDYPEGHSFQTRFGTLIFDNGAGDNRLARLGAVLRWLETARTLPRDKALQKLVDGLPDDALAWMYSVKPGTSAVKVPDGHMFGFHTQEQHDAAKSAHEAGNLVSSHQGRRMISTGIPRHWQDGSIAPAPRPITPYSGPAVSEPGLPVLRLVLSRWAHETLWVPALREQKNTTDFEGNAWQANYLAVPLAKAAKWWGYGKRATQAAQEAEGAPKRKPGEPLPWSELVANRKPSENDAPPLEWTAEQVRRGQLEKAARIEERGSSRGVVKGMAGELKISDAALNLQLKKAVQFIKATGRWEWEKPGKRQAALDQQIHGR